MNKKNLNWKLINTTKQHEKKVKELFNCHSNQNVSNKKKNDEKTIKLKMIFANEMVNNYSSVELPTLGIFDSAVMLYGRAIHILNLAL